MKEELRLRLLLLAHMLWLRLVLKRLLAVLVFLLVLVLPGGWEGHESGALPCYFSPSSSQSVRQDNLRALLTDWHSSVIPVSMFTHFKAAQVHLQWLPLIFTTETFMAKYCCMPIDVE